MKKHSIILSVSGMIAASALTLSALYFRHMENGLPAGTVDKTVVKPAVSDMFSVQDYNGAAECVIEYFPTFECCDLHELRYAGDKESQTESISRIDSGYASDLEFMVLTSDFFVQPLPLFYSQNDAWEHNSMYKNFKWILCRTKGDTDWIVCDHGYC